MCALYFVNKIINQSINYYYYLLNLQKITRFPKKLTGRNATLNYSAKITVELSQLLVGYIQLDIGY